MYGFIGAGEITAAIVEGLSADVADPPMACLSPRGREVGRALAGRFANVSVCASNQEVLDKTAVVVVAVRAQSADQVLPELAFRPEHVVISAVAGMPLERLRHQVGPVDTVVRAIPLPSAASAHSLTVVYPDHRDARGLFERVGEVIVPAGEAELDAFSAATATFAAHLDYLATIAGWLSEHGVEDDLATRYVAHVFGRLGQSLLGSDGALGELAGRHTTPGGINEMLMQDLRRDGVPDHVRRALDRVLARLVAAGQANR